MGNGEPLLCTGRAVRCVRSVTVQSPACTASGSSGDLARPPAGPPRTSPLPRPLPPGVTPCPPSASLNPPLLPRSLTIQVRPDGQSGGTSECILRSFRAPLMLGGFHPSFWGQFRFCAICPFFEILITIHAKELLKEC